MPLAAYGLPSKLRSKQSDRPPCGWLEASLQEVCLWRSATNMVGNYEGGMGYLTSHIPRSLSLSLLMLKRRILRTWMRDASGLPQYLIVGLCDSNVNSSPHSKTKNDMANFKTCQGFRVILTLRESCSHNPLIPSEPCQACQRYSVSEVFAVSKAAI